MRSLVKLFCEFLLQLDITQVQNISTILLVTSEVWSEINNLLTGRVKDVLAILDFLSIRNNGPEKNICV